MGLLHDIGRREGITGILHLFDGYDYLMELCEPELTRICLTHSFPRKDVNVFLRRYDCSRAQLSFLNQTNFDDYDVLIQLCGCNIYELLPNALENSSVDLL